MCFQQEKERHHFIAHRSCVSRDVNLEARYTLPDLGSCRHAVVVEYLHHLEWFCSFIHKKLKT